MVLLPDQILTKRVSAEETLCGTVGRASPQISPPVNMIAGDFSHRVKDMSSPGGGCQGEEP